MSMDDWIKLLNKSIYTITWKIQKLKRNIFQFNSIKHIKIQRKLSKYSDLNLPKILKNKKLKKKTNQDQTKK